MPMPDEKTTPTYPAAPFPKDKPTPSPAKALASLEEYAESVRENIRILGEAIAYAQAKRTANNEDIARFRAEVREWERMLPRKRVAKKSK